MKIQKSLPFEQCETCDQFVLDSFMQNETDEKGATEKIVNICCQRAWMCQMIDKNYEKKNQKAEEK